MILRFFLTSLLCITLTGCATSGTRRGALPAVQVIGPEKLAENRIYADRTSGTAALIGAQFGIVGGLVGGAIAAASASSGVRKFDAITRQHGSGAGAVIRKNVERALAQTGKLPPSRGAASDWRLRLTSANYGVAHTGQQRFAVRVTAEYELLNARGKRAFKIYHTSTAGIEMSRAQYESDPNLYAQGLELASQGLGRQIAADMIEELDSSSN